MPGLIDTLPEARLNMVSACIHTLHTHLINTLALYAIHLTLMRYMCYTCGTPILLIYMYHKLYYTTHRIHTYTLILIYYTTHYIPYIYR